MIEKTKSDWEAERNALVPALREFAAIMRHRPFKNVWGLRGVSAFALFYFLRKVKPTAVFEVGVSRGFSTWLIEQAVPQAEVYCFDPIFYLDHLIDKAAFGPHYRSGRAHYFKGDFSCEDIVPIVREAAVPLVYFDDHQNCAPRLYQAKAAGFRHLVFDDNHIDLPFTHRTLDHEKTSSEGRDFLDREIAEYQVFPALWSFESAALGVREDGLDSIPLDEDLTPVFEEREWHSYVTYVRLVGRTEPGRQA